MAKRKVKQTTPLKQTHISSFFSRTDSGTKRLKTDPIEALLRSDSPDIILCTPPKKNSFAKRNLEGSFRMEKVVLSTNSDDFDSGYSENIPPICNLSVSNETVCSPHKSPKKAFADSNSGNLDDISIVSDSDDSDVIMDTPQKGNTSVRRNLDGSFQMNETEKRTEEFNKLTVTNLPVDSHIKCTKKEDFAGKSIDEFDDFAFGDDWVLDSPKKVNKFTLSFEKCVTCYVVSSEIVPHGIYHEQILILKDVSSEQLGRCILKDMWALNVKVLTGDSANVQAQKKGCDFVVDAQQGFVCLYPDLMVSSTSLVGAMFCRRRGILSNLFRGLDTNSKIMVLGSLVHEILQSSLRESSFTEKTILDIIDAIFTIPSNLRMLYSCDISIEDTRNELIKFIPFVIVFMKTYVTQETKPTGNNFSGFIDEIKDIEENVNSLRMGIKGRIDVTVQVKIHGKKKLMPLEVKTGRASFSNEHRSQVILYTMMMSEIGEKVETGLLLYLKEGRMEEIKPTYVEIRDLILLRNDFAQYLNKFDRSNLPEPIRMANACKKCPYLTVCSAYLDETTSSNHPIRTVAVDIDDCHLRYFHKWAQLVFLDDSHETDKKLLVLENLTLEDGVVQFNKEYKYSFKRGSEETNLSVGNFVVLTVFEFPRSYNGRVVQMNEKQCSIALDRKLEVSTGRFKIEGIRSSLVTRYLTNLGHLLEEPYGSLRSIVVNREPAKFSDFFPKSILSEYCFKILSDLNAEQQRAVLKLLTCQNYFLVEGPPGSGKTQTIVAMIRFLLNLKKRVLLVGHTHSSVDNVLIRISDVDYLRLGNVSSIRESVREKSYANLVQNAKSVSDVSALFGKPLVASTCLGLDDDLVEREKFDFCIVDESSQVLQPEVLKPLFAADKFVLIGDSKQLRPVVKNAKAKSLGMDVSIFEWLEQPSSVITLKKQYRMNKPIMDLANDFAYEGVLLAGSDSVEKRLLNLENIQSVAEKWLRFVISPKLESSIILIDTSEYLKLHPNEFFTIKNSVEANIVKTIVETFLSCGVLAEEIGVMAPFRAQLQILSEIMPHNVEANTVDQFQGRDKAIVLFSCTRQNHTLEERSDFEILNDYRRLTVAITRAKSKLVIVGDRITLNKYKTFQRLLTFLRESNILVLTDNVDDFSWDFFTVNQLL